MIYMDFFLLWFELAHLRKSVVAGMRSDRNFEILLKSLELRHAFGRLRKSSEVKRCITIDARMDCDTELPIASVSKRV